MVKRFSILGILTLILTGCAGVYKQAELNGVGYRDTKITDNSYLVRFLGNQRTTQDQTYQYALKRSAELSKQQGYPYFKIIKTSSFMREDSRDVKKDVNPMGQYNTTPANDLNEVLDFQNRAASFDDVISIQRPMTVMWIKFYQQPVKGAIATKDVLNKVVKTH